MDAASNISPTIHNGLYVLAGVCIGLFGGILRDWINNHQRIRLEKVKIHEKHRIDAYKRLFMLARKITEKCFPLAENKREEFTYIISKFYRNKVEQDYSYFDSDIIGILDDFNEHYSCMTDPDLIPEIDQNQENRWLEDELYTMAGRLERIVKKAMKV